MLEEKETQAFSSYNYTVILWAGHMMYLCLCRSFFETCVLNDLF